MKNVKWKRLVSRGRNHAVLMIDSIRTKIKKDYFKKKYGISYIVKNYAQFDGSRWISEEDYSAIFKILKNGIKNNPKLLYKLASKMEKEEIKSLLLTDKYKSRNWKKVTNKEIIVILEKFVASQGRVWPVSSWFYGWDFFFDEGFLELFKKNLEEKLGNNFNKVWEYLIQPEKLIYISREKMALLKLAQKFFGKKIPQRFIEEHAKKFDFVGRYYFWGKGLTAEQVSRDLDKIFCRGKEYIEKSIKELKLRKLDIDKFEKLSPSDKWIIKGYKKMGHVSNAGDEVTNYYIQRMTPFFNEIAKRLGISYEELVSMRVEEIKKSLTNGLCVSRKILNERYEDHALILTLDNVKILSGKELRKFKGQILKKGLEKETKELRGGVAYKNNEVIRGKIKIIENDNEVSLFKDGYILVTKMTNPNYLPAMKRSKAIITDEGGMLCHAAIVSRELKIPCIIGTKIATKVLKDGDLVEVDANNGIVKLINNG
ncbi:MAG: hypothetical protein A2562_00495 [Candidatus Nealsonbacteria bacterium RIFOXYD1_FULL_39_11]|nr:MAG: hypothetical protein A2562_00495 [Candidatus Nealsonbacteria bacterium RIFOXYD1_FULL_39_11]